MSELKPCPFCDGPATYVTVLKIAGDYSAAVICERCNAKTDFMRANDEEEARRNQRPRLRRLRLPHVRSAYARHAKGARSRQDDVVPVL